MIDCIAVNQRTLNKRSYSPTIVEQHAHTGAYAELQLSGFSFVTTHYDRNNTDV